MFHVTPIAIALVVILSAFLSSQGGYSLKVSNTSSINSNSEACLKRANQLDKCLPKLVVYGDREFNPPRTEKDLDEHCQMLDENLKCVSSYSRECLPPFARNLYSVVTRRLKTQFAKRCKTKDGRSDFINLMACADAKHMEPAHKCMDSFIAQLEHIGRGNETIQIELICCAFQVFQECIFSAPNKVDCRSRVYSTEKAVDYVRSIINSMGGDVMDLMCGKFDKVSTCLAGHPGMMKEFKIITEKIQNSTLKAKSNSPLKPMLQLFINAQDQPLQ